MKTISAFVPGLLFVLLAGLAAPVAHAQLLDPFSEELRQRLTAADPLYIRGERIWTRLSMLRLYEQRDFNPIWVQEGQPTALIDSLLPVYPLLDYHGLTADDYHRGPILALANALKLGNLEEGGWGTDHGADLELLLTDAALLIASHLARGKVDKETVLPAWTAEREGWSAVDALTRALDSGRLQETFAGMLPASDVYTRTVEEYHELRRQASEREWLDVPPGETLRPGMISERVPLLRARLRASGDLLHSPPEMGRTGDDSARFVFTTELAGALAWFQQRHGLKPDSALGPRTVDWLNLPLLDRANALRVNLDRMRWLPEHPGRLHVRVNLPEFMMRLYQDGSPLITMRAIIGRDFRKTPVMMDTLEYMVINPYWNVPTKLAVKDKIPKILADSTYLESHGIKVFAGWSDSAAVVDPDSVDWAAMTLDHFPYRLRQDPSRNNALGVVKFMFPNKHSVYMHDTPSDYLFAYEDRMFSSGCIRLERPRELANFLLSREGWSERAIDEAFESSERRIVSLSEGIPVYVQYLTAWVDRNGVRQFRADVYQRNPAALGALQNNPIPVVPEPEEK